MLDDASLSHFNYFLTSGMLLPRSTMAVGGHLVAMGVGEEAVMEKTGK
jgi:hypothetical protein